jgi:hypothetical protein
LGFGESAKWKWTELKEAERTNAHAMSTGEEAMAKFVNHERDDESKRPPTERDDWIDSRNRNEFTGRWW